jgi:hypothetical protein
MTCTAAGPGSRFRYQPISTPWARKKAARHARSIAAFPSQCDIWPSQPPLAQFCAKRSTALAPHRRWDTLDRATGPRTGGAGLPVQIGQAPIIFVASELTDTARPFIS